VGVIVSNTELIYSVVDGNPSGEIRMYVMSPYTGKLLEDKEAIDKYNNENRWGFEVAVDLGECDLKLISSKEHITKFAIDLAKHIDMKRYGEPIVVRFGSEPKVEGYSLVQLIETSMISGHFAEDTNRAFINIFSCKEFGPKDAAEFSKKYFGAKKMEYSIAYRDI
jgi:S-adenosylmethionine/arginine decarboxylase-like enzyme